MWHVNIWLSLDSNRRPGQLLLWLENCLMDEQQYKKQEMQTVVNQQFEKDAPSCFADSCCTFHLCCEWSDRLHGRRLDDGAWGRRFRCSWYRRQVSLICAQNIRCSHLPLGWGQYLGQYLTIPVVNSAIAGRSARSYTDEGRFNTLIDTVNSGDFVVIEFGHNDGLSGTVDNGREDAFGDGYDTTSTVTNSA